MPPIPRPRLIIPSNPFHAVPFEELLGIVVHVLCEKGIVDLIQGPLPQVDAAEVEFDVIFDVPRAKRVMHELLTRDATFLTEISKEL